MKSKQSAIPMKDRKLPCHRRFRNAAQHTFNPLHVYCRLADAGAGKKAARRVCTSYERIIYKPVLGG
jgi:hypothetical protein